MKIESLKKRQRRYVVKTEKQRGMRGDMTIPVCPGASQAEYIRRFEELNYLKPV